MSSNIPINQANIVRIMPNKWDYNRKRRTARRMQTKGLSEAIIKEQVWSKW